MEEAKFHVGVKALIVNERNEILLLKAGHEETKHTKIDFWDLPGGRIKVGYGIEETLRREIKEELGISGNQIEILSLFDVTISNFKKSHGETVFLMLLVYKCKLSGNKEFKLSDEHSEYRWILIDDAKKLLSLKYQKGFIDKLDYAGVVV